MPKVGKKPMIPNQQKKQLQGSDTILNLVKSKGFSGQKKLFSCCFRKRNRISIDIDVGSGRNAQPSWQAESGPSKISRNVGEA